MALQGNLRDFPATEILQLLGSQKKSGCLLVDGDGKHLSVYVQDGRIVSTREPGLTKDDPLLVFLKDIHRLSDEQVMGLETIHHESDRDLEELLINGRYLESQELAGYVERQILGNLMELTRWTVGSYRFDATERWMAVPLVKLSIEGALMEIARRADEQKRYAQRFNHPNLLLSVCDLPDPTDPLTDEERDLFGIIDGRHTVAEVVKAAPLTEFEAIEALHQMIEAGWIEIAGRRDERAPLGVTLRAEAPRAPRPSLMRETMLVAAVIVALLGLRFASRLFDPPAIHAVGSDVFAASQMRDLRFALDLYRREIGHYPTTLEQLVDDRFIEERALTVPGYTVRYRTMRSSGDYALDLVPDR